MSKKIYTLIDHGDGQIRGASWEALSMGRSIAADAGSTLHAVLLGQGLQSLAQQVAAKKVDSVLLVEDAKLAEYNPDTHCDALRQLLEQDQPELLTLAHIYQNIDLAPKLAAALKRGLATDCIGHRVEGDDLLFVRQMFRNKINALVKIRSPRPWIATMQAGAYSADDLGSGDSPIVERRVDLSGVQIRRRQLEAVAATKGKVDLTKAEIIVGVGRGVKKPENLTVIQELADALGAEIGASRPVVDNEWLERERQIGSSGQTVSPKLYVACGISGAIQHIVGMKGSQCIVAINSDPNAPIFNVARYGIVGDLFEVVPALTQALKQQKTMG